jgi:hypothetical protein|tara:strand:+ start:3769 stop:3918 length:150 start_codon:yes stop_codon:yes gene_type:complete
MTEVLRLWLMPMLAELKSFIPRLCSIWIRAEWQGGNEDVKKPGFGRAIH